MSHCVKVWEPVRLNPVLVWSNFFNVPESFFSESESFFAVTDFAVTDFVVTESLLSDSATANCAANKSGNINNSRNHIGELDALIKQFTPGMLL